MRYNSNDSIKRFIVNTIITAGDHELAMLLNTSIFRVIILKDYLNKAKEHPFTTGINVVNNKYPFMENLLYKFTLLQSACGQ